MRSAPVGMVLAGGTSRRMGRDKALLNWRGRPLMTHMREQLIRAGCRPALINRNGPGCIHDVFPDAGPVAGIHAVIQAVPAPGYLVVPVDMPLLRSATLRALVDTAPAGSRYPGDSCLPCYLDTPEPQKLARLLQERLQQEHPPLRWLLEELRARPCSAGTDNERRNINTPEQWRQARPLQHAIQELS